MGGACVYVSYHPSDSVAVEQGDALWFGVIALLLATIIWGFSLWCDRYGQEHRRVCSLADRFDPLVAWHFG